MLANCKRFIERRCEGGHWSTYQELERRVAELESVRVVPSIDTAGSFFARMVQIVKLAESATRSLHALGMINTGWLKELNGEIYAFNRDYPPTLFIKNSDDVKTGS